MGPSYQYTARMVRVVDGDTYEVSVDLGFRIYHSIHVRLKAFDTAELASTNPAEVVHAKQARDFVAKLLPAGTKLVLKTAKAGIYNRWQASVWYPAGPDHLSLAQTLATAGFAKKESYP